MPSNTTLISPTKMLPIFPFMFFLVIVMAQAEIFFSYSNFSQISSNDVALFDDAVFASNSIQLTKFGNTSVAAGEDSSGQFIQNLAIKSPIISFSTTFSATLTKTKNSNFSGEGFAFFFTPNLMYYQHPPLGRFGLPTTFLALVFDTSPNVHLDAAAQISLCINNSVSPLKTTVLLDEYLDITNAQTFYVWIEYNSNMNFSVFVNNDINKPLNPVLFGTMDLNEFFTKHTKLYVGFSAYSIHHNEVYDIASWSFTAFSNNSQKHNKIYIIVGSSVAGFLVIVGLLIAFFRSSTGVQFQVGVMNSIWKLTSRFQRTP